MPDDATPSAYGRKTGTSFPVLNPERIEASVNLAKKEKSVIMLLLSKSAALMLSAATAAIMIPAAPALASDTGDTFNLALGTSFGISNVTDITLATSVLTITCKKVTINVTYQPPHSPAQSWPAPRGRRG